MSFKKASYLFPFAREAAKSKRGLELGSSMLGFLAANDAKFIMSFLQWSGVDTSKIWAESE